MLCSGLIPTLPSDTGRTCNQTTIGAAVGATLGAALLAALALFATERRRRIRAENSLVSVHTPPLPGTVMTEAPASYSQPGKQGRYHPAAPHEMDPHGELYEADSQTTVGNNHNVHNVFH